MYGEFPREIPRRLVTATRGIGCMLSLLCSPHMLTVS